MQLNKVQNIPSHFLKVKLIWPRRPRHPSSTVCLLPTYHVSGAGGARRGGGGRVQGKKISDVKTFLTCISTKTSKNVRKTEKLLECENGSTKTNRKSLEFSSHHAIAPGLVTQ